MTVYVLENGCYSDTRVVGIYSTRDNAELAAQHFRDDAHIEEHDLDAKIDEMQRGYSSYFVRLNRETGDVMSAEVSDSSYGAFTDVVSEDVHKNIFTHCWAENTPHAIKIASERRRAFLALPSVLTVEGKG